MQAARRKKVTAGLGLLSMLLGAVMVVTPTSAAAGDGDPPGSNGTVKIDGLYEIDGPGHTEKPNDPADDGTDTDPHVRCAFELEFFGFDQGQTADITFTAIAPTGDKGVLSEDLGVPISPDPAGGAGQDPDGTRKYPYSVIEDWDLDMFTSVHEVHGWHVKLALTLYDADGRAVPGGQKHKTFWLEGCETPPPPGDTGSISVDKVLTGTAAGAQATTAFPFTVSCTNGEVPVTLATGDASFALTGGAAPKVISGLPVGATCTVTETNVMGAATTTVRVGEGTAVTDTDVTTPAVTKGATVAVTFTNDFPGGGPPPPPPPPPPTPVVEPEPATLQVVKAVTGDAPTEWTAGFRVVGAGLDEAFNVDEVMPSRVLGELEPGGYAVTETMVLGDPSTLVDVGCVAGTEPFDVTVVAGTATVVLDEGDSVVCTFTNDYPVVEPEEVVPTTEPVPTTKPEVKGDVVTRTLPRTGSESRDLAALGVFLLAAGAGLVAAGTRRRVTVS